MPSPLLHNLRVIGPRDSFRLLCSPRLYLLYKETCLYSLLKYTKLAIKKILYFRTSGTTPRVDGGLLEDARMTNKQL